MTRIRILLLGPDCNPDRVSIPYVAYCHAAALAKLHDVTIAVRAPFESPLRRANAPFCGIEVVRLPLLESIFALLFRTVLRSNFATQLYLALYFPLYMAFEWRAWRQLRRRIHGGEFEVVLRVIPVSPVVPSLFAFFLRNSPIPFVIGPLNGGLPWPKGFSQAKRTRGWASYLRGLYKFLPFARSTYRNAAAIIAGSSQTYGEFARHGEKLFFVPENGVHSSLCSKAGTKVECDANLELIFAGGLIPIKGCDIALRAAEPLLRNGSAHFTIVGDGPERERLEQLTRSLGIGETVTFCGWLRHEEVLARFLSADVFVFPSIRDFGGGVVFEALAAGAVPVVVDFGGPGDIVRPDVGYKVPLTNEEDVILRIKRILLDLAGDRGHLRTLQQKARSYARDCLTWDAKARATTQILNWALRRGPRPAGYSGGQAAH